MYRIIKIKQIFKNPFANLKNRNHFYDLIKLFALLLVILDHSLQRWISGAQNTQLYNFIFLTQMPLFVFVSGIFFLSSIDKRTTIIELIKMIPKIIVSFMVPFVSFTILKGIIVSNSFVDFITFFYESFLYPQQSLWFLWVLMWIQLIIVFSSMISLFSLNCKRWLHLLIILGFYLLLLIPIVILYKFLPSFFDSKLILFYSFFFLLGCLVSALRKTKMRIIFDRPVYKLTILLCLLAALIVIMIVQPHFIIATDNTLNIFLRLLGSTCSIVVCCFILSFIPMMKVTRYVSFIGAFSLEFYYTHLLILLVPLLRGPLSYQYPLIYLVFIGLYLLLFFSSLLAILLLKSNLITDFFLFGKIPSFLSQRHQRID